MVYLLYTLTPHDQQSVTLAEFMVRDLAPEVAHRLAKRLLLEENWRSVRLDFVVDGERMQAFSGDSHMQALWSAAADQQVSCAYTQLATEMAEFKAE